MSFSCSDFADVLMNHIGESGLARADDIPDDDPERGSEIAVGVIDHLTEVRRLAAELAEAVLKGGGSADAARRAAELTALVNQWPHRWLVCEQYMHCFTGSIATVTRWVMDLQEGRMYFSQRHAAGLWLTLPGVDEDDLFDDVANTNFVRERPDEYGATQQATLPDWAPPTK